LVQTVLDALVAAGKDLDRLDVDDLSATDQFHGGGRVVTDRLAERAGLDRLEPGNSPPRVLDVGGGLGGPARVLAAHYGCVVTTIDLTPSYVEVACVLTAKVGLQDRVEHLVGDALELPFDDEAFDVVWTQNTGMNIADKETLLRGFHRALRLGGTFAFQEPMAGPGGPLNFPVMWADDASSSFLRPPNEMRDLITRLGFQVRSWDDVSESIVTSGMPPPHSAQRTIMGDQRLASVAAAGQKNLAEGRLVTVHGVFTKA
jgi:ubiquinone/menaquinone biosynthesis C-methylase UbiE